MKNQNKKHTLLLFCTILTMMFAFPAAGCSSTGSQDADTETPIAASAQSQTTSTVIGEGKTMFTFVVVDKDKNETVFEVHTDKETVGDALSEYNLISGEESSYGLFVKTVNGITADYDKDQTYWAFYINDTSAPTGVDTTDITEGYTYSFKVEK